jgi:hypothetical protein
MQRPTGRTILTAPSTGTQSTPQGRPHGSKPHWKTQNEYWLTAMPRSGIRCQPPSAGRLAAPFDRPRILKSSHVTPCERSQQGHRGRRATGDREENVSVDRRCSQEEDH